MTVATANPMAFFQKDSKINPSPTAPHPIKMAEL